MARVDISRITKRFAGMAALSDVTITIDDGEFFAVYGPPGAGKSTILKVISGIETPDEGKVLIAGRDMAGVPPHGRDVTMAFESYALYPHFSVKGNLEFPLKAPGRGLSEDERSSAIADVAKLLEIDGYLDRRPYQLSGGQRQRVSLGRALVRHASVTLLDEPIAHLDARLRNALRAELRHYQRERGATTVYATPDYSEAFGVADRIAVLIDGHVEQCDTPQRVFATPANTRVAALVGDPKINLIPIVDGAILDGGGRTYPLDGLGVDPGKVHHVGLRPDDVEISVGYEGIRGTVYVSEPVGPLEVVRVQVGEHLITARRPVTVHARMGDEVVLQPRWERALAFGGDGALLLREGA